MPRKTTRNAQGNGCLRQRADGRWEGLYTVGRDPGTGKQVRRSVYAATQEEAAKKLRQATAAIDDGTYIEPSRMTVGQWLDLWHSEYLGNIKSSTAVRYEGDIKNHLKPAFGALKLAALKPPAIQKLYNGMKKDGLSPKTIKNAHGCLHRALQQAVLLGYIRVNPSDVCILPRIEKTEIKPLDEAELTAFLKTAAGHPFENIYKVAVFTGMREGELLGLTWDRVDLKRGVIEVNRQLLRPRKKGDAFMFGALKNDKPRTLTPAPSVMEILKAQRKAQLAQKLQVGPLWDDGPGYVFTDELGGHASYWQLIVHLKKLLESAGVQERRFHDLRHTYAVNAIRAGDDIKTVQHNLGHHTAAFTLDIYGHVTESMKKDSAARMEAFISGLNNH